MLIPQTTKKTAGKKRGTPRWEATVAGEVGDALHGGMTHCMAGWEFMVVQWWFNGISGDSMWI